MYFDFRDTMATFRVNMSDPRGWSNTHTSSFRCALTLQDFLSPPRARSDLTWIGPGATLGNFASVDHTHMTFTASPASEYIDYLSELTGLPVGITD